MVFASRSHTQRIDCTCSGMCEPCIHRSTDYHLPLLPIRQWRQLNIEKLRCRPLLPQSDLSIRTTGSRADTGFWRLEGISDFVPSWTKESGVTGTIVSSSAPFVSASRALRPRMLVSTPRASCGSITPASPDLQDFC